MKATQRDFASLATRAAGQCRLFFFCGPDEAGASVAAEKLVARLAEPGERVELSGPQIKSDPVLLVDEARSASLFGGARHLFVRVTGDEAHDAVRTFIALADAGETSGACPVVIVASSASDKSRTAKLLAGRKDALVAMFWPPDLSSVTGEVRTMADAAGVPLGGNLAERVARAAGLDVRLARAEIEKLALYLDATPQSPKPADAEALEAICAVTEEDGLLPLVNAVFSGRTESIAGEICRMHTLGLNPVSVVLALERRAAQLARMAADAGNSSRGGPAAAAREPFSERRHLADQLGRWNAAKLDRLLPRLTELHRAMLTSSAPSELLLSQAIVQIARFASNRAG